MGCRTNIRVDTDIRVMALLDGCCHACTAMEISSDGMVLERCETLCERSVPDLNVFELHLGGVEPIRVRAKTVWTRDVLQAIRFVALSDLVNINIAEQLDKDSAA